MKIGLTFSSVFALPLLLALLLGATDSEPPTPVEPEKAERSFTIKGSSLVIQPGPESTYLRFGGGVVCTARGLHLSADILELDVSSSSLQLQGKVSLPSVPNPISRAVDDPGEIAQAMASELKLPKASFSGNAISRVGAKGGVKVESKGMSLKTGELVSTDGGNSWTASGRTVVSSSGLQGGGSVTLAADNLFFDVISSSALAKGNIEGSYFGDGFAPVAIKAQRLGLNQTTGMLVMSDRVSVEYGSITLVCGQPAEGTAGAGVAGSGGSIEINLDSRIVVASGGVVLEDISQEMRLFAGKITVSLDKKWAEATGHPQVTRGGSSISGERILVTDLDGRIVVEVSGPQDAVLVQDEPTPEEDLAEKENPQEAPGDLELE